MAGSPPRSMASASLACAAQADGSLVRLETVEAGPWVRSDFTLDGSVLELGALVLVVDDDGSGVGAAEEGDEAKTVRVLADLCGAG